MAVTILKGVHKALKTDGVLAIADHIGVANTDNEKLHRIGPAVLDSLQEKAGFEIIERSDISSPE